MNLKSCIVRILDHKWLTTIASLVVFSLLCTGMPRLIAVDADFRNHFSKDDARLLALDELEDTYAVSDSVLITVTPDSDSIFDSQTLSAIEDFTDELWQISYVTRVDSIANYSHSEGVEDELIVRELVEDAESLDDSELQRIERIALNTEEVAGRLVSRDGRVGGVYVSFVLPGSDRNLAKLKTVDALYDTMNRFRDRYPGTQFHMTGSLILNRAVRDALNEDFGVLGPASLIIMLVLTVVMLRSIRGTIAVVLMLVAIIPATLGFSGWTGMSFYPESAASIFVLMAITVAHCVHIITGVMEKIREGLDSTEAIVESLRMNVWPVFLTSLTTAIGFLSLNFSEMPPFRVMGNVVAFGSMLAFVYSVTLLPIFLSVIRLRAKPRREGRVDIFNRFGQFVVARHRVILYSSTAVVIVLLAGLFRIELDDDHLKLLDERYEFRRSADFIIENFSGLDPLEYSLSAGREGGITEIEYLRQVEEFANWNRQQPEVTHVFSITDIIKRLNKNLNGDNPEFYTIPNDSDLVAQYLLLYEFSLPVGHDLNNQIDVERSSTRMTVVLAALTTSEKLAFEHRALQWLEENAPTLTPGPTGVTIVGAHSIKRNIVLMLIGTIIAMGFVSLILMLVFKSLRFGLISLIPNFVPAAMAMGLWGYTVGQIGVTAAVVTAIAFGIIVDDTIHFLTKYLRGRRDGMMPAQSIQLAFNSVGKALCSTTLIFALGFIVYGASGMANNQALGLLMVMTVVIALLADFLFLPPLLMILDRVKGDRTAKVPTV
ncbi:MAG: MMPL family transporter [Acidiferrobacterales bacterium]|nr:MMPL family transporter [Acidiferrobacterales bacterium]